MSSDISTKVTISDFDTYFVDAIGRHQFDRVVLFDVLEHFSAEDGAALLRNCSKVLAENGRIVIRTPNMASPFGLAMQFNDVTHKQAYTPGSIHQVAHAAGCEVVAVYRQAYGTWRKETRERILTGTLSFFLSSPPLIWTPNFIAVLKQAP